MVAETVAILAGGDVMLGSWVQDVVRKSGWFYPFAAMDSVIDGSDIFMINLEAPFGEEDSAFAKTYTFQVAPDLIEVLTAGRIGAVSLANNHIMDFGPGALKYTMDLLREKGIVFGGAGMNLQEAGKPAILKVRDMSVAIACYSLTFPKEFWATDTTAGTCFPYHTFFYKDIRKFKQENDLVIVSFHWGSELMETPKEYQTELARNTIDAGADIIIGHHPHVIQGIEIYKGRVIAYSLGNFIFGSYSENAREAMLLKFSFGTNGIQRCRIYPINVYNAEVEFQPRFLTDEDKIKFFNKLVTISTELNIRPLVINTAGWIEF